MIKWLFRLKPLNEGAKQEILRWIERGKHSCIAVEAVTRDLYGGSRGKRYLKSYQEHSKAYVSRSGFEDVNWSELNEDQCQEVRLLKVKEWFIHLEK